MLEPVRILRVVSKMDRGGLETIIMNTYKLIDRTKVQFDFIVHTKEKGHFDDEIKNLGGRIFYVPKYTFFNHFYYKHSWNIFFKNHRDYKVIHGHIRSTASIYLLIAKKYGLVTIAHSHNISSGNKFTSLIKDLLQVKIKYIADYFLACSLPAGKWLFGKNITKKPNFKVVPNGIDVSKFRYDISTREKIRKNYDIDNNRIVIGHVGRFHTQKNHKFLISIFFELTKINSNVLLLLIGDGKLRKNIEKRVLKLGLKEKVLFLGVRNDVPDLLQIMDVFLFPSLFEGFGNVVVEAQSSGLPCIISNKVPNEVILTDLVKQIDLKQGKKFWVEKINEILSGFHRDITDDLVIKSGFDVNPIAKWYENFYINIKDGKFINLKD